MNITAKFYDRKTLFNNVPVNIINREFNNHYGEDCPIILIYKDGAFTGYAEPWAGTVEEAETKYTAMFEQQEKQEAEAAEKAQEPSAEERIAAAMEYQNLMSY